ncbi:hypothetical protein OEZ86_008726 [Tetradesmus obliquus]|nr:hypothetical protein OEZ86_008726 [Tetradesmus obliquus]
MTSRIFDGSSGRPVAVLRHFGKNPFEKLDPLSLGNFSDAHQHMVSSYMWPFEHYLDMSAMRTIIWGVGECVHSDRVQRHAQPEDPSQGHQQARQNVYDGSGQRHLFNIGKESKLKAMALRSNLAVRGPGDNKDVLYSRTVDELVCFVQKSTKALVQEAALGSGSEMMIDVAPGVDWAAMIAVIMAVQQRCEQQSSRSAVLAALRCKGPVGMAALQGLGMYGIAYSAGSIIDGALQFVRKMQMIQQMSAQ